MTPEQFILWLQGFFSGRSDTAAINKEQAAMIRQRLAQVLVVIPQDRAEMIQRTADEKQ